MKKNLITIMTAAAMLASTAAVFAADEPEITDAMPTPEIQGDIMLINDIPEAVVTPSYASYTVNITNMEDGMISTTTDTADAENPDNTINFTTSEETVVLNGADGTEMKLSDLKKDDTITVFSSVYNPAPYILPPQYIANVIIVDVKEISSLRFYDVDTYIKRDGALVNFANTLELNLDENTKITGLTGRMTTIDELENKDLAVVYSTSTRSIPAQTTPIAIYVLGENEAALAAYEASKAAPEETIEPEATEAPVDFTAVKTVTANNEAVENFYVKDGILMLPLRKIAEAFDFSVEWDGNLRAVMLNSGMYSLKIGENSYIKGRMMPQELSAAPEITNDLTFVPVDYFLDILELTYNINGDVLEF